MTDGIVALDIAVVGRDTLWVVELMNTLTHRADAYVREYVTVLEAADDLSAGHPSVVLLAPLGPDDVIDPVAALAAEHPEWAVVAATDQIDGEGARTISALLGIDPIDWLDTEAVVTAVVDALQDRRQAADRLGFGTASEVHAAEAAADALVNGPAESMRIIAVTGGKGGAGASTFAVNLAAALVEAGQRVTLVDGHGATGDVGFLLDLPKPDRLALELVAIDAESIPHYTAVHPATDVRAVVLPSDENQLTTLTPRQLLEVLVALGEHTDVVVADLPVTLVADSDVATFASSILLVTTATLAGLKNTRIAADAIGRSDRLGLVCNEVRPHAPDHGRGAIESALQVELLAELPYDDGIEAGANADPVSGLSAPSSKYTKVVRRLAARLLDVPAAVDARR